MSKICIAFMTHNSQVFEKFLIIFQDEKPLMIHCLNFKISIEDCYKNFIGKKYLEVHSGTKIPVKDDQLFKIELDVNKIKAADKIQIDTEAKKLISRFRQFKSQEKVS